MYEYDEGCTGYPARKTVKNQKQFWQIKLYQYITEIYITILYYFMDRIYICKQICWKLDKGNFFRRKIPYYYLAGYPAIPDIRQISIRCNPKYDGTVKKLR